VCAPRLGGGALWRTRSPSAESGAATVRLVDELTYQAGSWPHERRVVVKAEALAKGPNTRFVVTSRDDPPEALYDWAFQVAVLDEGVELPQGRVVYPEPFRR